MKIKAAMEALGNIIYLLHFMYFYRFRKRIHFTHSNERFFTYIILDIMLWVKLTKDFSIHSRKSLTKQVKLQHKTHRLWGNSNYENLQSINLTDYYWFAMVLIILFLFFREMNRMSISPNISQTSIAIISGATTTNIR